MGRSNVSLLKWVEVEIGYSVSLQEWVEATKMGLSYKDGLEATKMGLSYKDGLKLQRWV